MLYGQTQQGNFPWSCYFEFNPPQTRGAVINKCLELGKDQLEVGTAPLGPQYWEIWYECMGLDEGFAREEIGMARNGVTSQETLNYNT